MNRGSFMLLLMNLISFKLSPSNIGHVSIMLLAKKKKKRKKLFKSTPEYYYFCS